MVYTEFVGLTEAPLVSFTATALALEHFATRWELIETRESKCYEESRLCLTPEAWAGKLPLSNPGI